MKITLLTIGKSNFPFVKEGMAMYEKRITRYTQYERIEIPALSGTGSLSPIEVKEKEGELILKKIKPTDELILLDERGKKFTSVEWAQFLEKKINKDIVIKKSREKNKNTKKEKKNLQKRRFRLGSNQGPIG